MIKLDLTVEEVNGILSALGELPTKTNALFLIQKIQAQAQPQLQQPAPDPEAETVGLTD